MPKLQKHLSADGTIFETTRDIIEVKLTADDLIRIIKRNIDESRYEISLYDKSCKAFRIKNKETNIEKIVIPKTMNGGGTMSAKKIDVPFTNKNFLELLHKDLDVEVWGFYFTKKSVSGERKIAICRVRREELLESSTYSKWLENIGLKRNSSSKWFKLKDIHKCLFDDSVCIDANNTKIFPIEKTEEFLDSETVLDIDKLFSKTVETALKSAIKNPKSTDRIIPLHMLLRDLVESVLPSNYTCTCATNKNPKEDVAEGLYSDFKTDISIRRNKKIVACVSFKLIASNFSQNNKNYLRNLQGETVNIQRVGISNYTFTVLPKKIPYLKRDGTLQKVENITDTHIEPFIKMASLKKDDYFEVPKAMCLYIVDTNLENFFRNNIGKNIRTGIGYENFVSSLHVEKANPDNLQWLEKETRDFLKRTSDINLFLKNILLDLVKRFPEDFSVKEIEQLAQK